MNKLNLLLINLGCNDYYTKVKTSIVIAASNFLIESKKISTLKDWYSMTKSREGFINNLNNINQSLKLNIFKNGSVIDFFQQLNDEEFQKIIKYFNDLEYKVDELELVGDIRELLFNDIRGNSFKFITRDDALRLVIDILNIKPSSTVIDSFNGYSGVYYNIKSHCIDENKPFSTIQYYGQEVDYNIF